jgi:putative membrane protein, TIGR04086 family/integral membrane protein, TIGR04097 family
MKQTTILTDDNLMSKVKNISKGLVISIITTIIALFIYSIILTYTNVPETTIMTIVILITGFSILVGGYISSTKIKSKGFITGGAVGIIYILILYITSSTVSGDFGLNLQAMSIMIFGMIAGMVGGVIGVNIKK